MIFQFFCSFIIILQFAEKTRAFISFQFFCSFIPLSPFSGLGLEPETAFNSFVVLLAVIVCYSIVLARLTFNSFVVLFRDIPRKTRKGLVRYSNFQFFCSFIRTLCYTKRTHWSMHTFNSFVVLYTCH